MTDHSSMHAETGPAPDRRSFITGALTLWAVGATASFAPVLAASPAAAQGAGAASCLAGGTPSVFWGLPYIDFTGTAFACTRPARYAVERQARDLDPHAELLT